MSVYVREEARGKGVGRALYTSLFAILRLQGIHNILAGITLPNPASVAVHEVMGLRPIGLYQRIGYKCGEWHDVGWWQLAFSPPGGEPLEPLSFQAIWSSTLCSDAISSGLGFKKRKYS